MGQDCELLAEVNGWINAKATVPVWAKMTPNITDITQPALASAKAGVCGTLLLLGVAVAGGGRCEAQHAPLTAATAVLSPPLTPHQAVRASLPSTPSAR
jgi:hypothetical protein